MLPIVLASSSPYRRALLERLDLPFNWAAPEIDETPKLGESARQLTLRLAQAKASALIHQYPQHLLIGSDQVLLLDGAAVSKPGTHQAAREQLRACSGRTLTFLTSLCLLNSQSGESQCVVEPFEVVFRTLNAERIERYLLKEQPYDCAGSFKMEGLGITLFHALHGDDPNSLIGLPLIRLCDMLIKEGVDLP
ncbi:Maf family protein [Halopseudomonas pelagia]|uniref:Maf family protein n=1 Tax=Halopseudomonas pelagia TaxID=553151 RepID=UPI0003A8A9A7|nr:Maf family nucleotide pyrophosphatase [Halopseudomonas pelagia]|tara:strand:+ start:3825 stop:4403 length:579 start_codon:yes stop_codon:yes gene_type:complete